ncbi:MAG: HTH-type transcriptional regulator AcrR [Syntrophorhabdus sp. PtaU1.Bin002]|nr:MAG: HTH-type transcriptional regulator AcrR [Syntrophorhabdus sp. PtaB.Bin006]OPY71172.1 MAG: HTH-type transcriptional regulator AcrR [Syntrophorhabdus sp. PtaU1.Bin002]
MKVLRQDAVRTRKSLLTVASEVFAEKGYRDATVAEISERAGTNVAAISYHFGGKEALYGEAWRYALRESIKTHPPDGGVDQSAPPEKRLAGQMAALLRRINDTRNKEFWISYKEMANPTGLLDEVMEEEIKPLRRRTIALVREILSPGNSEEEVRFCATNIVGLCVIPTLINMVEKRHDGSDNESLRVDDIEGYAKHVVTFALAGMRAIRYNSEENMSTHQRGSHEK